MAASVSIIIPTHNRPAWLRECLEAIACDPWPEREVIVVNDGGSDVTSVVAAMRPRLSMRLLQLPANRGHVFARNEGVRHAQGDVIVLCDDDDILIPGHLGRAVAAVAEDHDAVAYSDAEVVRYHWDGRIRNILDRSPFAYGFDATVLRQWNTVIPSGVAYARQLHGRLGLFDEAMYHYWDWDFFLRASLLRPLRRIPVASVLYMVSDAEHNLSAQPERMREHLTRLRSKHFLDPLPSSSFARMQAEPALLALTQPTRIVWDGQWPVHLSATLTS
ncbi:MAG: glycosyltransferase family 2 protein [Firmicutes bacterium]|nr:glycosyltransferase family 2 protein [Bacillota bacterium]